MATDPQYRSDRWITPGVIIAALFIGSVLVAVLAGYCAWLMARGIDPTPLVDLVAKVGTAAAAVGTLLLQLFGRTTVAKVERNTGTLAAALVDYANQTAPAPAPAPAPRAPTHAAADVDEDLVEEAPPEQRRDYYGALRQSAAHQEEETGEYPRVSVPPIATYDRYRNRSRP